MRDNPPWDLLVVGGGTAGIVAARTAAQLGARVALIERDRTGGDCLWTGCVPSKALLAAAAAVASAGRGLPGVLTPTATVDFAAVMEHVAQVVRDIEPVDSPAALEQAGVTVLHGDATFTGRRAALIDGRPVSFRRAVVATGAHPVLPGVPGLTESQPLTSETVWALRRLPGRLAVLGGGSIGCELSQAFARLGAAVTLVEAAPQILPREDPEAASLVRAALEADGVEVLTGHRAATVVAAPGGRGDVHLSGASDRTVPFDALLVAVGRRPTTEGLGLEALGVEVTGTGHVRVDATLRTTNPRVWAAGDVTPHPAFTHVAGVHGSIAAANAVLGLRRRPDVRAIPRVTFTDPEVAAVGVPTWDAGGDAPTTVTRRHDHVDRAVAERRTDGFTRLALGSRGRLVGATVVGPRAGESVAELTLAVRRRVSTRSLAATVHAYPTYSDGVWNAAIDHTRARLASPPLRRLTHLLTALRRLARHKAPL